jgi:hypothetical protein
VTTIPYDWIWYTQFHNSLFIKTSDCSNRTGYKFPNNIFIPIYNSGPFHKHIKSLKFLGVLHHSILYLEIYPKGTDMDINTDFVTSF